MVVVGSCLVLALGFAMDVVPAVGLFLVVGLGGLACLVIAPVFAVSRRGVLEHLLDLREGNLFTSPLELRRNGGGEWSRKRRRNMRHRERP